MIKMKMIKDLKLKWEDLEGKKRELLREMLEKIEKHLSQPVAVL